MKKVERTTKTFLENWLQKTIKQYVGAMKDHENGQLYDLVLGGVEKPLVEMVLKETAGNQTQAANVLGINRNTLRKKIQEYNLWWIQKALQSSYLPQERADEWNLP